MTRVELVEKAALAANVSKRAADETLTAILDGIEGAVMSGDGINIQGFGTFSSHQRGARTGRNPQTGEEINIPPKKVMRFKVSKVINHKLNGTTPPPKVEKTTE